MAKNMLYIALVGNPNSGKSSLFNCLTGLNQKVGNFPGVTVDKKTGFTYISDKVITTVIDLPGTYSLYPKQPDEWVSYRVMMGQDGQIQADVLVVVVDASNLKRNLLFASQIIDLKQPVVIALTMADLAKKKGIQIDLAELERELGVPVLSINPRKEKGIVELKKAIEQTASRIYKMPVRDFIPNKELAYQPIEELQALFPKASDYTAIHYLINHEHFNLEDSLQDNIEQIERRHSFNHTKIQASEILQRYNRIKHIMQVAVSEPNPHQQTLFTEKLDNILLDRKWGYVILLGVLFFLFQSIFWLAHYPMDWIEQVFSVLSAWLSTTLPQKWWSDLLINGVVAGLSGIMVFVPQIMILFGLITLLEDTGYMARISFLMDRLMRGVGLNGKSVMPLIGGFACAVPAIMSARTIENKKERLLTILITPLMSCSARLPVYVTLVGLVIPNKSLAGIFNLQGLIMMCLYLLGIVTALVVACVARHLIKFNGKSFFILELPMYRSPRWKNLVQTMINKAKIFVSEAGRIIMLVSLLLWGLSSFGPSKRMAEIEKRYALARQNAALPADSLEVEYKAAKLQNSYAGIFGKAIEPTIKPLGYDWKVGIAILASFAAREVFVGTMATIYSVGDDEEGLRLRDKLRMAKWPNGKPVFTLAAGISLLLFYVFAMQCVSTLAIIHRETQSWKWPIIQFTYMTTIAYLMSLLAYQILK
ncbi:ferrous iron transporter B [Niastella vici]|uniref:Ferrous iron transport protein B n=1 Tax=Niastella vici TaxID=1703345 RepID=A0A1V9FKS5_9BACT|nr:ferrous iron transport protein B [Niastella vici]OQP58945.1 ferrous iron transporter B [Niastella vici]